MISSSILNSVTFKKLSGSYPNQWNTLHSERKHGAFNVIPYCQPFNKDHTLYLQFTSEISTDVVLKSYHNNTQVESFTSSYASSYGTGDVRYFFNFVILLDNDYLDKKIYFTATQGTDVLTSEPIFIRDMTEDIANGTIKYLKYTNLDRTKSDLDDRFIDWSAITNTGNYLDMFIEAVDLIPNDSDSVEVFEGSQSKSILSANYFVGKILKTGGIPDFLVAKLGMMSSLDIFMVNDIQYIKEGEIEIEQFGTSTSFQVLINLTQKNAIGINVDNLNPLETEEEPTSDELPMYIGAVDNLNPDETSVKLMTARYVAKSDQDFDYTITNQRFCFAYPTSYGSLASIMAATYYEIISAYLITTVDFTIEGETVNYTIYTFYPASTTTDFNINYKFS
jgi:hypothetical protein